MIYGDVIIYKFKEDIPKVDDEGKTLYDDEGNILVEVKERTLKLRYTAFTPIYYKNITARDLMQDMIKIGGLKKEITAELMFSEEGQEIIDFIYNLVAAMIMSAEGSNHRDFEQIITTDLASGVVWEVELINEVVKLLDFGMKKKLHR